MSTISFALTCLCCLCLLSGTQYGKAQQSIQCQWDVRLHPTCVWADCSTSSVRLTAWCFSLTNFSFCWVHSTNCMLHGITSLVLTLSVLFFFGLWMVFLCQVSLVGKLNCIRSSLFAGNSWFSNNFVSVFKPYKAPIQYHWSVSFLYQHFCLFHAFFFSWRSEILMIHMGIGRNKPQ